jgi:predicted GNAT family acetyltransferase
VGAFHDGQQIGVARALSDTTRFAYIADVFVHTEYRGQGIAREMTRLLIEHPLLSDADCCYLLTDTAHGVYEALGFRVPAVQGKLMYRQKIKAVEPYAIPQRLSGRVVEES